MPIAVGTGGCDNRPKLHRQAGAVTTKNQAKDKETLVAEIYQRYRQELCLYIASKFELDAGEAEDIVQSAFIRFADLDSVHDVENPRAFLYKATTNLAIDLKRHTKVKLGYAENMANVGQEADERQDPARLTESRQRLSILSSAMWNMPSKRRKLLIMNRFDGLSYAEIARQVGLSETVVRKHISKALADCHKALHK
jgi:RNA polymerase sigma factor (sigma-70 family)